MVKQVRAQATRDALVSGAAEVFRRRGYGLASIAEIAAESGMTKGALYFHFSSKDELARAVIDAQHRRMMEASSALIAEGRPALETMVLVCADIGHRMLEDPIVQAGIRLTIDVSRFERQPIAGPYVDWILTAETLFRRAVEEGDIDPSVDPSVLANFLVPALTGVQLVSETLTEHGDLLQRIRELWMLLIPGIAAAGRLEALKRLPDLVIS